MTSSLQFFVSKSPVGADRHRPELLLHDDNQRLVLCCPAVNHERSAARAGALVAGKVHEIGRNDAGFSGPEESASFSFDLESQAPLGHEEQFLGAGMHGHGAAAPGGNSTKLATVS